MSFHAGDIVRIGAKGKVEYKVEDNEISQVGEIWVTSQNTGKGKWINPDRLTLVHSDWIGDDAVLTDAQIEELDETYAEQGMPAAQDLKNEMLSDENAPMAPWEIELLAPLHSGPYLLTVDHVTTGHKSYGAAADALVLAKRGGFKHYAVIDHNGQRLATRIAA